MNIVDFILIGLALSMDAGALTVANCTSFGCKLNKRMEWSMILAFSLFQFLMPIIGFYIGHLFAQFISRFAGYITAGVFFVLSVKIVFDIFNDKEEKGCCKFSIWILLSQAVATSIDALLIGFTFGASLASPFIPALIIGVVTFIIVSICIIFGKTVGKFLGKYAEWVGAIILFVLASKSLIEAIIG